ncbi:MAG: adaptor protein MecA [Bacilli bacterium]
MEIERINEHTIRFFISYVDIESRGYDREEIWFNRDKGEELFWDMMEEIDFQDEFLTDGPLWIQVKAHDSGIEVVVTNGKYAKNEDSFPFPHNFLGLEPPNGQSGDDGHSEPKMQGIFTAEIVEQSRDFVLSFPSIEEVIAVSKRQDWHSVTSSLYFYERKYYLFVDFEEELSDDKVDDYLAMILEYGDESGLTIHRLEEYGKTIVKDEAFQVMSAYF